MDTLVDDPSAALARRIRLERDARNWSLAELASRAGVAKATVSKVERHEVSPTAAVLMRLAAAFDMTLAGLLVRAEGGSRLSRRDEQPVWRDPETGYLRRQVFSLPDHPVEIVEVEMPAGRRVDFPASTYARIRQAVWVRSGTLTVTDGGERHELKPGDCLGFGPPGEATMANEGKDPCTYSVIISRS